MSDEGDLRDRLLGFENQSKTSEGIRRNRDEASIELRKQRRNELKKRTYLSSITNSDHELWNNDQVRYDPHSIFLDLQSHDNEKILNAVNAVRSLMSCSEPPIPMMIEAGLIPALVSLIDTEMEENSYIQLVAVWSLNNLAAGSSRETWKVIEAGAVPKFAALLNSPSSYIIEQAILALGNIAGDGPVARNAVLRTGALISLLGLIEPEPSCDVSYMRSIVWTISNLCRYKNPPPDFELVRPCIPVLSRLLFHEDIDIIAYACWAFSYLIDGSKKMVQVIINQNIIPRLVNLLSCNSLPLVTAALRVIGHIVTGNDKQTDAVLESEALPKLQLLLRSRENNIVIEAAWTISNVMAGTAKQIQKAIDWQILNDLMHVLGHTDFRARKEAAWAISNFTTNCSTTQFFDVFKEDLVLSLCGVLNYSDTDTITVVLEGLLNILELSEKISEFRRVSQLIKECGALEKIRKLRNHPNDQINRKASEMIEMFFPTLGHPELFPFKSIS